MSAVPNWRRWFALAWPPRGPRAAVVSGYVALGQHPHTLTDIALRNGVYSEGPSTATAYEAGVAEGRRRAALEIIKLASKSPAELFAYVEHLPLPAKGE